MEVKKIILKILRRGYHLIPLRYRAGVLSSIKKALLTKKQLVALSGIKAIDREDVLKSVRNNPDFYGVTNQKRTPRLIVSLTSYPERNEDVYFALVSLLRQKLKPDELVLWLSFEEYPDEEDSIPIRVKALRKSGLTIKFCKNTRSYKKLIPTLASCPDDIIVTADDDIYYPENWLERLYEEYQKAPEHIHVRRAHRVTFDAKGELLPYTEWDGAIAWNRTQPSFLNFLTGVGGILYPPHSLHADVLREDLFTRLSPTADDIWFWAMALLNGTKINVVRNNIESLMCVNPERELELVKGNSLWRTNVIEGKNDSQLKSVFAHYPELSSIVKFNSSEYWESRYKGGGNSGAGSYGRLADFKARIINNFIEKNHISRVAEFGFGDCNQLSLFKCGVYTGFDVSETVIENAKKRFAEDKSKSFHFVDEYDGIQFELSLSLDVIYHLIEDEVFEDYMRRLFGSSCKFVIVYAPDEDKFWGQHVKLRKFTEYAALNFRDFELTDVIKNDYPYSESFPDDTSFSDFYIYRKKLMHA